MTKKYTSKSCISFSAKLPNGTLKRIAFSAVTSKGSVYYASDPAVQAALENHPFFGRLYHLDTTEAKKKVAPEAEKAAPAAGAKEVKKKKEPIHVKYENLPDAKEYLARNFSGVSRTKLRTKADIIKCATENNVIFDGIEG